MVNNEARIEGGGEEKGEGPYRINVRGCVLSGDLDGNVVVLVKVDASVGGGEELLLILLLTPPRAMGRRGSTSGRSPLTSRASVARA